MIKIIIKEAFEDMVQSGKQAISQHWEQESKQSKEFKKSVEYYSNIFNKIDKSKFPKSLGDKGVQTLSMLFASNPQLAQSFGFNKSVKEQQEQLNYMGGEADKELIDLLFNSLQKVDSKINKIEVSTLAKAILAITKYNKPQSANRPVISQSENSIIKHISRQIYNSYMFDASSHNKIYFLWGSKENNNKYYGYVIDTSFPDIAFQKCVINLYNNIEKIEFELDDDLKRQLIPLNFDINNIQDNVKNTLNNSKTINEQITNRWKLLANIK